MNENETLTPKIDLFELFDGLLKSMKHFWWHGILLVCGCCLFLAVRTFLSYTPMYKASASFTVWLNNPFYASQSYYNTSAADQMARTFPHILTSGVLSEKVEEELQISSLPSISASALGNTNILTLTVTSDDPALAYDVLLCIMDVYPSVAEFVVGPTTLNLINETGFPYDPYNSISYTAPFVKGGVLGLGLWAGLCLLYWLTHQTVSSEQELKRLINLPCLGKLPKVHGYNKKKSQQCPVLTDRNDKFGFNESVRLLRVRVEKALEKSNGKVLLVTSTIANEGKTTISINLATAMAQKGKKVLLVDCDLRNPSVASALRMKNETGLSEYLKNEVPLKGILRRINHENLYVVFGGELVSYAETLLNSEQMHSLIKAAKVTFDVIVLDTPPCGLLADASEIGNLADCALLSVREDYASKDQILEGVAMLSDAGCLIIGTVLNMTKPKMGKSGYSYYGYYGQYGQSSANEKEVKEYA